MTSRKNGLNCRLWIRVGLCISMCALFCQSGTVIILDAEAARRIPLILEAINFGIIVCPCNIFNVRCASKWAYSDLRSMRAQRLEWIVNLSVSRFCMPLLQGLAGKADLQFSFKVRAPKQEFDLFLDQRSCLNIPDSHVGRVKAVQIPLDLQSSRVENGGFRFWGISHSALLD